jgi:hypothetical protein
MGELSCWARKNFQQRVQNFGWDRLPQPQQYHAMARVLLQLLELAERAFGDSEGVLEKQQRMARWPNIRPTNGIFTVFHTKVPRLLYHYLLHYSQAYTGESSQNSLPTI